MSNMLNSKLARAFLAGVSLAVMASPAQSLAQDEEDGARDDNVIVVTARKREESLQTVPVAITALSADALEDKGVRSPSDLGLFVPSLQILSAPGTPSSVRFSIRGQSSPGVLLTVDQSVGLYVDGVYIARPHGINAGFVDLERVEVLKGPQGTLYGRNTTGGAINIVSKGADYDGVHGYAMLEVGNHDDLKFGGAVNIPLAQDKAAVRVAYQRWTRDGFGRSSLTGLDLGQDRDQHFVRGTLQLNPTENLDIQIKAEYTALRQNGDLHVLRWWRPGGGGFQRAVAQFGDAAVATAYLDGLVAMGNRDLYTNDSQTFTRDNVDAVTLGGTLAWDISDSLQFRSVTGYRWYKLDNILDLDGTSLTAGEVGTGIGGIEFANYPFAKPIDQRVDFFSQEFNLSGQAIDDRLDWLIGAYFSDERGTDNQNTARGNTTAPALPPASYVGFFADKVVNSSWSIYSQNDFKVTDNFSLTLGARYTEEHRELLTKNRIYLPSANGYRCFPTGFPVAGTVPSPDDCAVFQEADFDGFSWLASANFQVTDDTLLYVRAAKGFRGGGLQLRSPNTPPVKPEIAKDIELGVKTSQWDGRFQANLAAYRTKYSNKQESTVFPGPPPFTIQTNAASAIIKGFEAEVNVNPAPGLWLGGTLTYLDGKYDSYQNAPNSSGASLDASGERFSNPRWSYSLTGRYTVAAGPGDLSVQADWAWHGKNYISPRLADPLVPFALQQSLADSVGLLNARIDYELPEYGVTASLFATNLLDKEYQVSSISQASSGLQTGITQEPRMWGFQLRKTFGGE
ncbi:MAG: TonB-dependent receptor [Blastomonas sp.]